MPLLMCPNDNAPMTTVDRSGVQFDMCPTCRGVWLDRGELEKLMQAAVDESTAARPAAAAPPQPQPQPYAAPPPRPHPQPWGYGERGEYGEYGERGEYGYRKKRPSIFDIFD
ncbi:zf-TFIIB domain-containing protein [Brevundimonas sp.]|uniref:TFIIB-type zinc ribbon-containing protein n=1 Tax=Brevundimonas sp. TaxID=1871086 RepID=UPI0022CCBCF9|nr:zf-TFIIB domain-containing protein [Brevundimonas sp.]MCZ8193296.1 zf-TFIIB domain-containing protein [Brevundimonas sp.]